MTAATARDDRIAEVATDPTEERIRSFLERYDDAYGFEYVLDITTLVGMVGGIDDHLRSIVDDEGVADHTRFHALYVLSFSYYRSKDITKLEELLTTYRGEFDDRPFYHYLPSVRFRERGNTGDYRAAVSRVERAVEAYPDNPGILKAATNAYLTAIENGEIVGDEASMLDNAEEYITGAISLYPESPTTTSISGGLTRTQASSTGRESRSAGR